jgi:hypothetical protein
VGHTIALEFLKEGIISPIVRVVLFHLLISPSRRVFYPEELSPWFALATSPARAGARGTVGDEPTDMVRWGMGVEEVGVRNAVGSKPLHGCRGYESIVHKSRFL